MQPDLRSVDAPSNCAAVTVLRDVPESDANWFETYSPPNSLLTRASTGNGKTPQEMLASAQAAVEGLHDTFVAELHKSVDQLTETQARLISGQTHTVSSIRELFGIAHEVKGQGRTFGFDLASAICEALCALLSRVDPHHPKLVQSIDTHIEALRFVSNQGLHGDGGDVGTTLVRSLWKEVQVVGGQAPSDGPGGPQGRSVEG